MKRGFSIIELIVSIVVIGIVFLAVPTILLQNSRNNETSIIQQSVMDAKTRIALILKAPWSCTGNVNLINLATPIFQSPNFYTTNGIVGDGRRTFSNILRNTPCVAGEDDLNSFNNDNIALVISAPLGSSTYTRDNIINETLDTRIRQVNMINNADADTKEVAVTTTALIGNNPPTILLRAYSSNIGDSPTLSIREW